MIVVESFSGFCCCYDGVDSVRLWPARGYGAFESRLANLLAIPDSRSQSVKRRATGPSWREPSQNGNDVADRFDEGGVAFSPPALKCKSTAQAHSMPTITVPDETYDRIPRRAEDLGTTV